MSNELIGFGGKQSTFDPALFLWHDVNGNLEGIVAVHVDDFVYAGTDNWKERVMGNFKCKFKISVEAEKTFRYIGLNVKQHEGYIKIDQENYVQLLKPIPISRERAKEKEALLDKNEKAALKSLCGKLQWVTTNTRVDMAYDTCMASNVGKVPMVHNILDANKAVRKIKSSNEVKLRFPNMGPMDKAEVVVYADATHASLPDGSSQGAFVVFVKGQGKVTPILWQSKKLKRVTKSPLASETLALGEAADAALLISHLMMEIYKLDHLPFVSTYTDSKSLRDAAHTTNTVEDMSLRVNIGRLREMVNLGEIAIRWIEGRKQLADVLTKRGASPDCLLSVLHSSKL